MIIKTDAIVLKSMKYRDTSKIVTFYTRRYGKVKGIAKGARETKSKFGAALEPMTRVSLVLYRKEQRELQLVSQCDIVKEHRRIHSEIERMAVGLAITELVNQLTHDEEENPSLFALLSETLEELERAPGNPVNLFHAFGIRLAALLGFSPALDACSRCGTELGDVVGGGSFVFQLDRGSFLCSGCASSVDAVSLEKAHEGRNVRVAARTVKILHRLLTAKLASVTTLEYGPEGGNEIDAALRLYLRQHFQEFKPLKSLKIFGKILN